MNPLAKLLLVVLLAPPAAADPVEDAEQITYDCRTMLAVYPPRDQCVVEGRGVACVTQLGPTYALRCWLIGVDCHGSHWHATVGPTHVAGQNTCHHAIRVTP